MSSAEGAHLLAGAVFVSVLGCKAPRDGDFNVQHGAEPANTCAIEGYLRGETPSSSSFAVVVAVTWTEASSSNTGGGRYATTAADRRFRVADLPCSTARTFTLAVMTDAHQGGTVHTTLAGNYDVLAAVPGDRLKNVRVDLVKGWSFSGTVTDAAGTAIEGVNVQASYKSVGGYGWTSPQEFTSSDAAGRWTLDGVVASRFTDPAHPVLVYYKKGYRALEQPAASGGSSAPLVAVLEKE